MNELAARPGTLSDVREARRLLAAEVAPAWRTAVMLAGVAMTMAGSLGYSTAALRRIGSDTTADAGGQRIALLLVGLGFCVFVAIWIVNIRHSGVPLRPRQLRLFARRVTVRQTVVTVLAWAGVLALAAWTVAGGLWPGWFGIAVVGMNAAIVPVMFALGWRLDPTGVDSPPLREIPDKPAVPDPILAARLPLMTCAALAAVGQVGADLLAKTLRVDEPELAAHTAGLVAAHYVYPQSDGRRWWLGLTPHGRTAYRRHLRALGAGVGGPSVIE